jgi:hypothetical protein
VNLIIESRDGSSLTGRVEARAEGGISLLARLGVKASAEGKIESGTTGRPIGQDINDLGFVADVIRESRRHLVIEDFHYLSEEQRRVCAFDLKALWDYKLFVVIVGIWNERNLFLNLNPDLTGRVREVSIEWNDDDLRRIFLQGGRALNRYFP